MDQVLGRQQPIWGFRLVIAAHFSRWCVMSRDGLQELLPDRYEVERELGLGGMATVYLAVDRKHDRPVAVKILHPELAAGIASERFLREIRIAAGLAHPHIVPLHDSGLAGDRPFYVMPYVKGESIRERLERSGQLPVDEALRIARDMGQALAYAHRRGVVHRDIKPGNVMLTEGGAMVTDFGIALAMSQAADHHLTRTGQAVGTLGYMSPEQSGGEPNVDERSDQYSLACVLYEMLAGEPPYTGRSARAILGKQLSQPPPPVSALRDSVPVTLDLPIMRALSSSPADRYESIEEFLAALESGTPAAASRELLPGARFSRAASARRWLWIGAASVSLLGLTWLLSSGVRQANPSGTPVKADTARVAIFPFEYATDDAADVNETQRLHDALARFDSVGIVDLIQLEDALERKGDLPLSTDAAAEVARTLGAGRFLMGRVTEVGDSLSIYGALYGADSVGQLIANHSVRIPRSMANADSAARELVSHLLFRGTPPKTSSFADSRSVSARQAFEYGQRAIREWDLARADTAFSLAVDHDSDFAQAHLWMALVRAWSGSEPARWRIPAEQALLRSDLLSERNASLARALDAQARGRLDEACPMWRSVTRDYPDDFVPWYGLAVCLENDDAVIPAAESPSGWAFRTSTREALDAYERAFGKLPSILESFHPRSFESLRRLFRVAGNQWRTGRSLSDGTTQFVAEPGVDADTLTFVPHPAGSEMSTKSLETATRELRSRFRSVSLAWAAAAPRSPRARHLLALALGMVGDPAALDTLRRARALNEDPHTGLQMAGSEVWLLIALHFPELDATRRARLLADSILREDQLLERDPSLGAGLAALLGRANAAAAYSRRQAHVTGSTVPRAIQSDARALLVFAALGGPADSLSRLEGEVTSGIDRRLSGPDAERERARWLVRPSTLAFPSPSFAGLEILEFDPLAAAQGSLAREDTSAVLGYFDRRTQQLSGIPGFILTIDAVYPEAALLAAVGDTGAAAAWLDRTLEALPEMSVNLISPPERAAALVRAAALRARLALAMRDEAEGRRWRTAVLELWSDADPFLLDTLRGADFSD